MNAKYDQIDHDGIALTGAKMHLDNPHLKKVSKSFDSIEPGDNVFFVELKLYNKHNGNYTCIRECYPNKRLAEMGLAFWRMHPGVKVDYYHSRTGVATHAMQCRVKGETPIEKDPEPDTLGVPEPETLVERPYDVRPGESTLDAYRRYLEEQEGT